MTDPQTTWIEVSRSQQRRKCDEHALVLQAVGLPYGRMSAEGQWLLLVRPEDRERALHELERYERENVGWPPRELAQEPISGGAYAALAYATLLGLIFIWQSHGQFGLDWLQAGRAEADRIVAGEWWRAITALTLHADLKHLLGNLVFGSLFGVILAHSIGAGPAWLATLVSGALGNLLNAWIQPADHASIGASTAVFGALGVQVAYEWMRRRELRRARWRRWAPLIGGLALLGWLGVGGSLQEVNTTRENIELIGRTLSEVDVMAHATGFVTGLAIGAALATVRGRLVLARGWQIGLALATPALIALAWTLAFTR